MCYSPVITNRCERCLWWGRTSRARRTAPTRPSTTSPIPALSLHQPRYHLRLPTVMLVLFSKSQLISASRRCSVTIDSHGLSGRVICSGCATSRQNHVIVQVCSTVWKSGNKASLTDACVLKPASLYPPRNCSISKLFDYWLQTMCGVRGIVSLVGQTVVGRSWRLCFSTVGRSIMTRPGIKCREEAVHIAGLLVLHLSA